MKKGANKNWIGSDRTGPDRTGPDRTGSDRTRSDRTGSGRIGSDRNGPNRIGPDRIGPDRTGPDRAGPDRTGPDRSGSSQLRTSNPESYFEKMPQQVENRFRGAHSPPPTPESQFRPPHRDRNYPHPEHSEASKNISFQKKRFFTFTMFCAAKNAQRERA